MTSSSSAPLLLADPIPRAEAHNQVPAAHTHQSLVRSWPPLTEEQQELYEKRLAEAKRVLKEQQEEAKKQQELATQRLEQDRQARKPEEGKRHEEIERRTPFYKFNNTTKSGKEKFKKLAVTEPVFVLEAEIATEYRRLRQEAGQLMHTKGPFSAEAMAAHAKFEAFNEDNLMWQLPSLGIEYEKETGKFWMLE